jgi:hypothetical protein
LATAMHTHTHARMAALRGHDVLSRTSVANTVFGAGCVIIEPAMHSFERLVEGWA